MALADVTATHHAAIAALTRRVTRDVSRLWGDLDPGDMEGSWRRDRIGEGVFVAVAGGQRAAASTADRYIGSALAEQGVNAEPRGRVNPRAFSGVASDGRTLDRLLAEPIITTRAAQAAGLPTEEAWSRGLHTLVRISATQVQDANRGAEGVAITSRPRVGWVRQINPPACGRCAILAGRFYRWSDGFARHPFCQCQHVPAQQRQGRDLLTDPQRYFDSLTADEQDRLFTKAGAEAIRDGADPAQVVNARRGMRRPGARVTQERVRDFGGQRLTPEAIYEFSNTREEAIEGLRRFGYLRA